MNARAWVACLCALAVLSCESDAEPSRRDAGPADAAAGDDAAPACAIDTWQLAAALELAKPVDYVADRDTRSMSTLSEHGKRCATAASVATCVSALALTVLPRDFGRHLATTYGDDVQFWRGDRAKELLGPIDAAADAIWLLLSEDRYRVPCIAQLTATSDGFEVKGITRGRPECPMNLTLVSVDARVSRTGEITEVSATEIEGRRCPISGTH